ncbi:unnamed protein product [Tenebrio molitor]|nr:unnamed protein product [Tenebrio molitor]
MQCDCVYTSIFTRLFAVWPGLLKNRGYFGVTSTLTNFRCIQIKMDE